LGTSGTKIKDDGDYLNRSIKRRLQLMPRGRPADPLWSAIGFLLGIIPGIYFHQLGMGVALGIVLGGALGVIREDKRRGYRRPVDSLWVCIGLLIGLAGGVGLHFLGLTWLLGLGLGVALGLVFGAVAGMARADRRRDEEQDKRDLAKRYRD
jgi:hypothetical protein